MNRGGIRNSEPASTAALPATRSAFAPLLITLIGLIVFLAWNLRVAIVQTRNLRVAEIQVRQASIQSAQTEEKLKAMLTDLLVLVPTDPDAAAIARRYRITQNAPAAAGEKQNPDGKNP